MSNVRLFVMLALAMAGAVPARAGNTDASCRRQVEEIAGTFVGSADLVGKWPTLGELGVEAAWLRARYQGADAASTRTALAALPPAPQSPFGGLYELLLTPPANRLDAIRAAQTWPKARLHMLRLNAASLLGQIQRDSGAAAMLAARKALGAAPQPDLSNDEGLAIAVSGSPAGDLALAREFEEADERGLAYMLLVRQPTLQPLVDFIRRNTDTQPDSSEFVANLGKVFGDRRRLGLPVADAGLPADWAKAAVRPAGARSDEMLTVYGAANRLSSTLAIGLLRSLNNPRLLTQARQIVDEADAAVGAGRLDPRDDDAVLVFLREAGRRHAVRLPGDLPVGVTGEMAGLSGVKYFGPMESLETYTDRVLARQALAPYVRGETQTLPAAPALLSRTFADWPGWTALAERLRGGGVVPLAADPQMAIHLLYASGRLDDALTVFRRQPLPGTGTRLPAASDIYLLLLAADRRCLGLTRPVLPGRLPLVTFGP